MSKRSFLTMKGPIWTKLSFINFFYRKIKK